MTIETTEAPYSTVTLDQAKAVISQGLPATYTAAAKFLNGDHWQDGAGWAGSQLTTTDATEAARVKALIARGFVSANKVAEVVGRHVAAVVGRAPAWRFAVERPLAEGEEPDGNEQALIGEAEAALTAWWDRVEAPRAIQQAVAWALVGRQGVLRLYVPAAYLQDVEGVLSAPPGTLAEQLERIEVEALSPDRAAVVKDPATGRDVGVVVVPALVKLFEDAAAVKDEAEIHALAGEAVAGAAPDTLVRIVGEAGRAALVPLGGRLLVAAVARDPLISAQVIQLQQAYNHSLTMMLRNSDQAGAIERLIYNAMRPDVRWNAETQEWEATGTPLRVGAGITNYVQGLPIYGDPDDPNRITGYTTPSGQRIDPAPVDTFLGTQSGYKVAILEEVGQLHALISGDATASGEARKQARAEFTASLRPTAEAVQGAVRAMLEACLALAAYLSNTPGRFDGLRADVTCLVDAGPLTGDEQREVREQHGARLLSTETAMSRLGVDDVDAEQSRIEAERAANTPPALVMAQAVPPPPVAVPVEDDENETEEEEDVEDA